MINKCSVACIIKFVQNKLQVKHLIQI